MTPDVPVLPGQQVNATGTVWPRVTISLRVSRHLETRRAGRLRPVRPARGGAADRAAQQVPGAAGHFRPARAPVRQRGPAPGHRHVLDRPAGPRPFGAVAAARVRRWRRPPADPLEALAEARPLHRGRPVPRDRTRAARRLGQRSGVRAREQQPRDPGRPRRGPDLVLHGAGLGRDPLLPGLAPPRQRRHLGHRHQHHGRPARRLARPAAAARADASLDRRLPRRARPARDQGLLVAGREDRGRLPRRARQFRRRGAAELHRRRPGDPLPDRAAGGQQRSPGDRGDADLPLPRLPGALRRGLPALRGRHQGVRRRGRPTLRQGRPGLDRGLPRRRRLRALRGHRADQQIAARRSAAPRPRRAAAPRHPDAPGGGLVHGRLAAGGPRRPARGHGGVPRRAPHAGAARAAEPPGRRGQRRIGRPPDRARAGPAEAPGHRTPAPSTRP